MMAHQREIDTRKIGNNHHASFGERPIVPANSALTSDRAASSNSATSRENALTHAPASIVVTGEPVSGKSLIDKAMAFVARGSALSSFASGQTREFVPDP